MSTRQAPRNSAPTTTVPCEASAMNDLTGNMFQALAALHERVEEFVDCAIRDADVNPIDWSEMVDWAQVINGEVERLVLHGPDAYLNSIGVEQP